METEHRTLRAAGNELPGVNSIWVYQYIYWDELSQTHQTSIRFATEEAIRLGLGVRVHSSGKKIRPEDLIDGAFAE
jgi:hypothetical protein